MIIALHIIYIVSFLLFVGALIIFYLKNEQSLKNKEPLDSVEWRFFVLLLISFLTNFLSFLFLLPKVGYLGDGDYFTPISAPVFMALFVYFSGSGFFATKYHHERYDEEGLPVPIKYQTDNSEMHSIYLVGLLDSSFVFSLLPSYILFGVFSIPLDNKTLPADILLIVLGVLSLYSIGVFIYRYIRRKSKRVSYFSFVLSLLIRSATAYCYFLLVDYYFSPIQEGPAVLYISAFSLLVTVFPSIPVTNRTEKTVYEGRTSLQFRDWFYIYQIADIIPGIFFPVASFIFFLLNQNGTLPSA